MSIDIWARNSERYHYEEITYSIVGLTLSMFGGVQKFANARNKLAIRGDAHCLIVGDPGLGKSQLLTAIAHTVPRGVYVCGNTTSTSGLTVTVVRDSSGDFSLEAGN